MKDRESVFINLLRKKLSESATKITVPTALFETQLQGCMHVKHAIYKHINSLKKHEEFSLFHVEIDSLLKEVLSEVYKNLKSPDYYSSNIIKNIILLRVISNIELIAKIYAVENHKSIQYLLVYVSSLALHPLIKQRYDLNDPILTTINRNHDPEELLKKVFKEIYDSTFTLLNTSLSEVSQPVMLNNVDMKLEIRESTQTLTFFPLEKPSIKKVSASDTSSFVSVVCSFK